jgi:hypothetical protein
VNPVIKLYRKDLSNDAGKIPIALSNPSFSVLVFKPTLFKTAIDNSEGVKRILWYLITFGRMRIFYILDGKRVVHYSYILPKNFRFPFMDSCDLQIGPCFTNPDFRGQGFYTQALLMIPSCFCEQTRRSGFILLRKM